MFAIVKWVFVQTEKILAKLRNSKANQKFSETEHSKTEIDRNSGSKKLAFI